MENFIIPKSGWIWGNEEKYDNGKPQLLYFRKTITFDEKIKYSDLKISADSRYRFFVNGKSVAFGPCKGDNQLWYQDEIDITPFLRQGENIFCAIVLRYSLLNKGNHSVWRTAMPGFYLEGSFLTESDEEIAICADSTWKYMPADNVEFVQENPYLAFLFICEKAKGKEQFNNWLSRQYDDSSWENAREYNFFEVDKSVSPGNLLPRPIPFMYEKERGFEKIMCLRKSALGAEKWAAFLQGEYLEIPSNSEEIVEIDAGELTTGFLNFSFINGTGAEIEILTSEAYAYEPEDKISYMPLPRKGNRIDYEKGKLYGFTDIYNAGGFGKEKAPEIYEPFWFRAFRFIRLKITTGEHALGFENFHYRETGYPLDAKTKVEASDKSLSNIWDISLRTLRRCMHETYEDCPFYEQLQYAMDTRSQILYTYSVAADDRMARRCIDDFHRSLRYDGLTNCCYPTVGANVIPGFSLYYILMIHDHMMYFGDKELVGKYMPTVDAILNYFERSRDERGIVGQTGYLNGTRFWSFIDWTPQWDRTSGVPDAILEGPITMESFLYAYVLNAAAELAGYIGKTEQAENYLERRESLKSAINKHCISEKGLYQDGPGVDKFSQHCQVWAVLSEVAEKDQWQFLMETALKADNMAKCSVAMAFYLFRAVEKAGMYERSLELWEPWHNMLKNNLTTCEEDQVNSRSDCHAWGSVALYELPSVVLGVRPAKPGYEAIRVEPAAGYLDWAKGDVITPKGVVHVEWKRTPQGIKVEAAGPEGVEVISD